MDLPKILAPVSRTENDANGLKYATHLARIKKAELIIFHAQKDQEDPCQMMPEENSGKDAGQEVKIRQIIRKGEPSSEILKIAAEHEPELIVMSPDIMHKEKKYFEESFTGKVIQHSHYPILIIPPDSESLVINTIVLGVNMRENIIEPVREILKIFKAFHPHLEILLFCDRNSSSNEMEEAADLLSRLKNYAMYHNMSATACERKHANLSLELYAEKNNADIICMENDADLFYKIFFSNSRDEQVSYFFNKPLLILPHHSQDSLKKA